MDYKTSGVDVEAGRAFVSRIKSKVEETFRSEVLGGLGGFGGLIRLPEGLRRPVLVAGADGVGTKLELAQEYRGHHNVGIDLVAMCVNDVITTGAEPLFFLDYIATGKISPEAMAEVVEGIAEGCLKSGCALLGGETAEMPGFYATGRYDLAGFCVAVGEQDSLINGTRIEVGDQIVGVGSSGVHSNGFSLVRKILEMAKVNEESTFGGDNIPLISSLLEPTKLYVDLVKALLKDHISIKGMAHITGGGLPENLPRCLPKGMRAYVDPSSWKRPEIFTWLQCAGQIPELDLWNTFNMGIGFCLVVPHGEVEDVLNICTENGYSSWRIGRIELLDNSQQSLLYGLE